MIPYSDGETTKRARIHRCNFLLPEIVRTRLHLFLYACFERAYLRRSDVESPRQISPSLNDRNWQRSVPKRLLRHYSALQNGWRGPRSGSRVSVGPPKFGGMDDMPSPNGQNLICSYEIALYVKFRVVIHREGRIPSRYACSSTGGHQGPYQRGV